MKAIIITLVVLLLIGGTLFSTYVSYNDYAVSIEEQIETKYEDNQNIHAQYALKIMELAKVPKMYANDITTLYKQVVTGTFGEDGSKAMFQFIKTANPNLDPQLYSVIQKEIIAGRTKFENAQTELLDMTRGYNTVLKRFWGKLWLQEFNSFPKIDLKKYTPVITDSTREAFETKTDKVVDF